MDTTALYEALDQMNNLIQDEAPAPKLRSELSFIRGEVRKLEAAYLGELQGHATSRQEHAALKAFHAKKDQERAKIRARKPNPSPDQRILNRHRPKPRGA